MKILKGDTVIITLDNKELKCTVAGIEGKVVYFSSEGQRICGSRKDKKKVVSNYTARNSMYHSLQKRGD